MERIIKFKAKRLDNAEWVEGDLSHDFEGGFGISAISEENGMVGFSGYFKVDPSTVCQFTGLKDKDGKEVCEHDILNIIINTVEYEVVFLYGAFQLINSTERMPIYDLKTWTDDCLECWKVVGNKFDRKEGEK